MKINKTFIIVICLVSILSIGCSKNEKIIKEDEQDTGKITMQDSLSEVKDKLIKASVYDKMDKATRNMEESLEYVKSILPQGIKETNKEYKKDKGITEVTYEVDDFKFTVWYIHPQGKGESSDEEYDLEKTSGIYFPAINWHS
ncbi:hypothetical protein SDC9_145009 [bioreactor metagenome]|uniref:Uncharacterized protein n=2 Tax=root TaxID=1 RepID=A0A645E8T5_9ZZZZ